MARRRWWQGARLMQLSCEAGDEHCCASWRPSKPFFLGEGASRYNLYCSICVITTPVDAMPSTHCVARRRSCAGWKTAPREQWPRSRTRTRRPSRESHTPAWSAQASQLTSYQHLPPGALGCEQDGGAALSKMIQCIYALPPRRPYTRAATRVRLCRTSHHCSGARRVTSPSSVAPSSMFQLPRPTYFFLP